jgi:RNA polymerase sigma-70 factor (ECF subfamily)
VIPVCRRANQQVDGHQLTEAALAAGFRAGDERAVREVVRRYRGPMTAVARSVLLDRDRADDAVQQAFLQAWRAAGRFDPSQPLGPWLFTITRRVCIDLYRRDQRVPLPDADAMSRAERVGDPDGVDPLLARWDMRRVLDRLPAQERAVVELLHRDGLTHAEIAERLGVPVGTVKSRVWRAYRHLARMVGDARARSGVGACC